MFRSLLFVPANNDRFIAKSILLNPDILCFDLEDSVPLNEKNVAREKIRRVFEEKAYNNAVVYTRINSVESGLFEKDLENIIHKKLDGIVIPKVNSSNEISDVVKRIDSLESSMGLESGKIKIIPSIETAKGVINTYTIAISNMRVNAIIFGIFDYLYDMDINYDDDPVSYFYARSKIPIDANAAGIAAIDGIWQKVDDLNGLSREAEIARKLGYSGKSIIHPSHIESVHRIFKPTLKQIDWAKKVLNALRNSMEDGSGKGAVILEGKMVDAVHYKQAKAILNVESGSD